MNILLVGASGSLGTALWQECEMRDIEVICVSRGKPDGYKSYFCDLADVSSVESNFQKIDGVDLNTIAIVNSGIIGPIGLGSELDYKEAVTAFNVNAISNISIFQELYSRGVKNFIVISSGASKKDYSGWFVYCQSKKVQKSIWESLCHDHKDISVKFIAPGVLDSAMHKFTNTVDRLKYPELDKFYEIKKNRSYQKADQSAAKILDLAFREDFFEKENEFIDLRDL